MPNADKCSSCDNPILNCICLDYDSSSYDPSSPGVSRDCKHDHTKSTSGSRKRPKEHANASF